MLRDYIILNGLIILSTSQKLKMEQPSLSGSLNTQKKKKKILKKKGLKTKQHQGSSESSQHNPFASLKPFQPKSAPAGSGFP